MLDLPPDQPEAPVQPPVDAIVAPDLPETEDAPDLPEPQDTPGMAMTQDAPAPIQDLESASS